MGRPPPANRASRGPRPLLSAKASRGIGHAAFPDMMPRPPNHGDSAAPIRQRSHADLRAVVQLPAFRFYLLSRLTANVAVTLLQAVIAWQVYAISGSALDLGLIGLVRFIPALATSLVSGAVVDTYDRRLVLLLSQIVPLLATGAMLLAIETDRVSLLFLYAVVLVTGLANSFEFPARQALLPGLVPRPLFTRAVTVNSTLQSLAFVTGPAVGGGLIAWQGEGLAYVVHGALVALSIASLLLLNAPRLATESRSGVSVAAIREGLAFVWHRPVVLGVMSLDMFAVIFGGAKALLPIYAVDILHAGAIGYGVLAASMEVGSLLMAVAMVALPAPSATGWVLLLSVAAFGVATIFFGLSTWMPLSVVAYAAVGMADQMSVIMRQTTIQLSTPDELRGRVTAVNSVFISASNQLGSMESGLVAAATNAMFAVVSGGVACLGVVGVVAWRIPALREYRAATSRSPLSD